MKVKKYRPTLTTVSHSFKTSRRWGLGNSPTQSSLRFLSIIAIVIAICEFSGLSGKVIDYYASGEFIPLGLSAQYKKDLPSTGTRMNFSLVEEKSLRPNLIRKRLFRQKSLQSLYEGYDPDMRFRTFLEKTQKTHTNKRNKYTFQLEAHWNDNNPLQKVCTIHNACFLDDGSILVHPWMRSRERLLHLCGARNLKYMDSISDYNNTDDTNDIDIFGSTPARYHIPHFLTDTMPMLYASELLAPQFTVPNAIKTGCETPQTGRCMKSSVNKPINPAIFSEDRVLNMTLSSWVPQVISMLPGKPMFFSPQLLFQGGRTKRCFRSIITFERSQFYRRGRHWFGDDNTMFRQHGLTRQSVIRKNYVTSSGNSQSNEKKCDVNISLLNREGWIKRGKFLTGRDITNVEEVSSIIKNRAQEDDHQNMDVTVNVEYFENKTFAEQVEIMQKADVLLGVHGAGLGNLLFAREDVPFLEVFPFGYYAGPFDLLSEALYLRYSYYIAEPDNSNFIDCLRSRAKRDGNESIIERGEKIWQEALRRKREDGDMFHMRSHMFKTQELSGIKLCARGQRMKVNAKEVAHRLLMMAQEVCGTVKRE